MAGSDLFTGSLDLIVLKAVSWGPLHGYAIARISDLMRGKIERFSIDTLVEMLARAGADVMFKVRRRNPARAHRK